VTGGACAALTDDPQALEQIRALRTEKQEAWQAWFDKYGVAVPEGADPVRGAPSGLVRQAAPQAVMSRRRKIKAAATSAAQA
jgi:hypothetical protein